MVILFRWCILPLLFAVLVFITLMLLNIYICEYILLFLFFKKKSCWKNVIFGHVSGAQYNDRRKLIILRCFCSILFTDICFWWIDRNINWNGWRTDPPVIEEETSVSIYCKKMKILYPPIFISFSQLEFFFPWYSTFPVLCPTIC